jgi:hypothetical protein
MEEGSNGLKSEPVTPGVLFSSILCIIVGVNVPRLFFVKYSCCIEIGIFRPVSPEAGAKKSTPPSNAPTHS